MENQIKDCSFCQLKSEILCELTPVEIGMVNQNRYEAHYNKGEILFKAGMPITHIIFIRTGFAKIYIENDNKERVIFAISPKGKYLTGPGLFYENKYQYNASAFTDMDVCFIDAELFKRYIDENKAFRDKFLHEFGERATRTMHALMKITTKKMNGRLADGILYLSEIFNTNKLECRLSRQELGELTNMAKESVTRILRQFEDDNIIRNDGSLIEILDKERLKRISRHG